MSKAIDVALRQAEHQSERELGSKLKARMDASAKDNGQVDTLKHTILNLVATESYPRAIEELREFMESKHEYPQFQARAERYVSYSIDLINATKAKRSFPGLQHLAMAKQQEFYDRAMGHFDELKQTLRKIEEIDRQVRLDDVRSTVWVVKALVYSVFAVLVLAFLLELSKVLLPATYVVIDDLFGRLTALLFDKIGF